MGNLLKAVLVGALLASVLAVISCQRVTQEDLNCIVEQAQLRSTDVLNTCNTVDVINADPAVFCTMSTCITTLKELYSACNRADLVTTAIDNVCNGSVRLYALPVLMIASLATALSAIV